MYLIDIPEKPSDAVTADQSRDILTLVDTPDVYYGRLNEVLDYLGVGDRLVNQIPHPGLPPGLPRVFFPHPKQLFAAMGLEMTPEIYSATVLRLLEKYGDGISDDLEPRLKVGHVRPGQFNTKAWEQREVEQIEGSINTYAVGFCPITRFRTGDEVYNLPALLATKPLMSAGAIPGGTLDWAFAMALYPELKSEVVCANPWIIHPGSEVQRKDGTWSDVSCCDNENGSAHCGTAFWSDYNDPEIAHFALF